MSTSTHNNVSRIVNLTKLAPQIYTNEAINHVRVLLKAYNIVTVYILLCKRLSISTDIMYQDTCREL